MADITVWAVLLLILVHLWSDKLRLICPEKYEQSWLSLSGGFAVGYVFIYVMPKLAKKQLVLINAPDTGIYGFLEHHAYIVALAGFIIYYGIDRAVIYFYDEKQKNRSIAIASLHLISFAAYSGLLGYLIAEWRFDRLELFILASFSLGFHLLGINYGLYHRYKEIYKRIIRWLLITSTVTGWGIGATTRVNENTLALWFSFVAGAIVINAIREELPGSQHGRFWPFLAGSMIFVLIMLIIEFQSAGY
jgi:zinc transporter ZupT